MEVINKKETHIAYSLLFSARGNISRSIDHMEKAFLARAPSEIFSKEFSGLFNALIENPEFEKIKK